MIWNKKINCKQGQGELIGYWIDLAGYYQIGDTVYASDRNGKLTNHGNAETFVERLTAGKLRGKLLDKEPS